MSEDVGAIAASSSRLNHKSKREAAVSEVAHLGAFPEVSRESLNFIIRVWKFPNPN
jgi:hypothetical protein